MHTCYSEQEGSRLAQQLKRVAAWYPSFHIHDFKQQNRTFAAFQETQVLAVLVTTQLVFFTSKMKVYQFSAFRQIDLDTLENTQER